MATLEDRLTLAAWNAATEGRGNTKLVWGTYTGTGESGSAHPNTLTFEGQPLWVFITYDGIPQGDNGLQVVFGARYCKGLLVGVIGLVRDRDLVV